MHAHERAHTHTHHAVTQFVHDKVRVKTELSVSPKPVLMLVSHAAYSSFHQDQVVTTKQVLH